MIVYLFLSIVRRPLLGQIYIIRESIDNLFQLVGRRSASYESLNDSRSLSSSSLSTVSTEAKHQKMKKRPCLLWNTNPIEVLLMSRLDGSDVTDPNFQYGPLSTDYIRRHLLSVHPKPGFGGRRAISAKTKTNRPITISNTYLILIPVIVQDHTKLCKLVPEFFDRDDLNYINSLLRELLIQESQQQIEKQAEKQTEAIDRINYELLLNEDNDDDDDNSSLPTTRSFFSYQYMPLQLSPLTKFISVDNKNFLPEVKTFKLNVDFSYTLHAFLFR